MADRRSVDADADRMHTIASPGASRPLSPTLDVEVGTPARPVQWGDRARDRRRPGPRRPRPPGRGTAAGPRETPAGDRDAGVHDGAAAEYRIVLAPPAPLVRRRRRGDRPAALPGTPGQRPGLVPEQLINGMHLHVQIP